MNAGPPEQTTVGMGGMKLAGGKQTAFAVRRFTTGDQEMSSTFAEGIVQIPDAAARTAYVSAPQDFVTRCSASSITGAMVHNTVDAAPFGGDEGFSPRIVVDGTSPGKTFSESRQLVISHGAELVVVGSIGPVRNGVTAAELPATPTAESLATAIVAELDAPS